MLFRSEGFAEDLSESHPLNRFQSPSREPIMTRILFAALFAMLAGCVAVDAPPPAAVAGTATVPPSFDVAMPAPQEPLDTTTITAVETVGASRTE